MSLPTPEQRFWAKVDKAGPCWTWLASGNGKGYGQFWFDGRMVFVHRWVYERYIAAIPEGLVIDHLCRNRGCVNPAHLEAVTNAENLRRGDGGYARKAYCPRGHAYTGIDKSTGGRYCHACKRIHDAGRRARNRAKRDAGQSRLDEAA